MSSYDATPVIAEAIQARVRQPKASLRFLIETDEQVALSIIDALERGGFEIVRRNSEQGGN
jgi:hypothetical protein